MMVPHVEMEEVPLPPPAKAAKATEAGAVDAEKVAKALKGEEGVAEREMAMLKLSAPPKAMAPGNESAADGGGKKGGGKKGRKK